MSAVADTVAIPTHRTHEALSVEIAWLRDRLRAQVDGQDVVPGPRPAPSDRLRALVDVLELSPFERDTLLLAAAVELDGEVAELVSRMTGTADPRPTFGLALTVLSDGHWDALSASGPLRRWRLVTLADDATVATARLRIDETILHHLVGLDVTDDALRGFVTPLSVNDLAPSQEALADDLARAVAAIGTAVVVHLDGEDVTARLGVAARLARRSDAVLLDTVAFPSPGPELATVITLVDRLVALTGVLPVLRLDHAPAGDDREVLSANRVLEGLAARTVVVIGTDPGPVPGRTPIRGTVAHPPAGERRRLWREELEEATSGAGTVTDDVLAVADQLAHQHRLAAADIRAAVRRWAATPDGASEGRSADGDGGDAQRLRLVTRDLTRAGLGHLAQRLRASATWDDLVLPPGHLQVLHDLTRQVRHLARVHDEWGFGAKLAGGLGITALFSGEPGTGKTLAAQVLANDLGLDLYRIDLSATVSKYIGETEKNLARIFDAAEASGAVLLFDEADALFGGRGEVRDGHDRYANLEVAYLLQRMESYRGLAILTTNLRGNLDRAFLRRIRFVLQFPFPDTAHRAEIWRRVFPDDTPLDGLDPDRLARVALTGGSIASIALSAAFAAADEDTAVAPRHLLQAARVDAAKHDRALTDTETAALS